MNDKNYILEYLKRDRISNVNIINFIESYPIHHIEKVGQSIFVKGVSDRKWVYISCSSIEELKIIKDKLTEEDKNFAIIEDWMIPILVQGKNIKRKLSVLRLVFDDDKKLSGLKHNTSELKAEDALFLYDNSDYKEYLSVEYITERIKNGISSCIRIQQKAVAWGMTQDDGAIGFLHVLPKYRRMGYGKDITINLINKLRRIGKIPFVHIEEENDKSMNLALSLGFRKDRIVSWMEIE
ncbi:FR47-like protein [Oxobacter pfennigii]|uniref:FR47-like protein n=1 Tax=Oxobacter pfennigii TaxID=36849 RepID=A0A0P9ABF6_9CLOT|nr:GNAT family N-acetyltransferase [Oxobacter pfennigii]KPU42401.1 FR47-like protein [Oxobacter pfennigii]